MPNLGEFFSKQFLIACCVPPIAQKHIRFEQASGQSKFLDQLAAIGVISSQSSSYLFLPLLLIRDIDEEPLTCDSGILSKGNPTMKGLQQLHEDGSESVLSYTQHAWHITLILSRRHGRSTLVGLMSPDLREAKAICKRVLENEICHVCTAQCKDWETVMINSL